MTSGAVLEPAPRDASPAAAAHAHLVAALRAARPTDPTLCEGWEARHVAAHVVLRRDAPWRLPTRALTRLADEARSPEAYAVLVDRFERPPARWSPHAWAANLMDVVEYAVHAEDVRRGPAAAAGTPVPATPVLPDELTAALWRQLPLLGRMSYRRAVVGVGVHDDAHGTLRITKPRAGAATVELSGPVLELVLHAFGRGRAAHVEATGPRGALQALDAVRPLPAGVVPSA